VERVYKDDHGLWIINDPSYGCFDGSVAAIGTCGDSKMRPLSDREHFKGSIWHSPDLDGKSTRVKKVVIIGGGASAFEVLDFIARSPRVAREVDHTEKPLRRFSARNEHPGLREDVSLDHRRRPALISLQECI